MPVILLADQLKDIYEGAYKLEIIDRTGIADTEPFNIDASGVSVDHQGSTDDPHSRIITSSCTFTMFIEDNAKHLAFKNLLVNSDEGQLAVKLYKYPGPELQFVGTIKVDSVVWEDQVEPYSIQILAVDGLARLRDIPYKPEGGDSIYSRKTILQHIIQIIAKLDMGDFFGTQVALLNATYWYEATMPNTTADPLTMVNISYECFADQKGLNQWDYKTCFEALEQIALLFNARFYHGAGRYIFEQINYRTEDVNTTYLYQYNGTVIGSLPFSNSGVIGGPEPRYYDKETGGQFTMIPPIREIKLIYKFLVDANYLHNQYNTWSYLGFTEILAGQIDLDPDNGIRFLLSGQLRWAFHPDTPPLDPTGFLPWKLRFKILIKIGDKYLKRSRSNTLFYSEDYDAAEWVDTLDYYIYETPVYYPELNVFDWTEALSLLTPIIQSEGEVRVNFFFDKLLNPDAANTNEVEWIPLDFAVRWWFLFPVLNTTLEDGNPYLITESTYRFNGPVKNSRTKEVILYIGDGPNTTNKRRVKVWDGTNFVESTAMWSPRGQTVNVQIQRLILLEMAQLLVNPLIIMNGNIIHHGNGAGFIHPYRAFNYEGNRYIFMSGRASTTPADFVGSWFLQNFEPIE